MNDPMQTDVEKVTGDGIPGPNDKSNPNPDAETATNVQPKKKIDIENARQRALEIASDPETNGKDASIVDAKTLQKQAKENITKRIAELKTELSEMRVDASIEKDRYDAATNRSILEKIDESIYSLKSIGYSSLGDQVLSTKPNSTHCPIVPGKIPTEPELIIKAKRDIPAAARYRIRQRFPQQLPGGGFGRASKRKDVKPDSWDNPGPARYGDTASTMLPKGGKFNKSIVPSFLDLAERKGSRLPAPSDYIPSHRPQRRATGNGAKWGSYRPKSEIEWIELRSKEIPGPKYDVDRHNMKRAKSQTFSTSVTKNFIDTAVFSKSCVPGPKYIPGSFDKYRSKTVGLNSPRPLQWDVGGFMNDGLSTSVDFLIKQAQLADEHIGSKKYRRKRRTRKQQEKRVREM